MAKRGDRSTAQIQKLLDERRKIEQWLQRLEMAADETAGAVRDRVRGDYEKRFTKVVEELQGFRDQLRASLDAHKSAHADLKTQEKMASEELAEAELRHAVGEFGESEWRDRKASILETLVKIRDGVGNEETEIAQLDDVLAQMDASPAPVEPAAPTPRPASPEEDVAARLSLGAELGLRDLGAGDEKDAVEEALEILEEPLSEPARESPSFGDELAFLKSVTEDKEQGPAASRAGGVARAIPEDIAPPQPRQSGQDVGAQGVERLEATPLKQSRPSVINQRTLKCGECGAMNLPTEWYCDRCGAELAAL